MKPEISDEVVRRHIENSRMAQARGLNRIAYAAEELSFALEDRDWNDEIKYSVQDAERLLGEALAALTTWYEDLSEMDKEQGEHDGD